MRKTTYTLLFVAILGIAIFFRLWNIAEIPPGLYPDEAMNGNNALEALRTGDFKIFYPENNGREGLFIGLQAGMIALFGNEPWALRALSALFGILTVLFTYALTKELFASNANPHNKIIALFAAFFIATSFWHINFSRIGFRAIMAPFFLTGGLYFLLLIFRDNLSDTKKTLAAAMGGLLFGLGFYSYIAYRIMALLLLVPFIKIWRAQRFRDIGKKGCAWCLFSLFLFFIFLTAFPLGMYFLNHPQDFFGRTAQISIFDSGNPILTIISNIGKTLGMFWFSGDGNWRHNFSGEAQLWWPIGILFAVGILISIFHMFKNPKHEARSTKQYQNSNDKSQKQFRIWKFNNWNLFENWKLEIGNLKTNITSPEFFLLFWIALGLLPVVFSNEGIPHALRALLIIPPVMILSGYALSYVTEKINLWLLRKKTAFPHFQHQLNRIRKELILLLFIFLIAAALHSYNQYFLRWAGHPEVYYAFNKNYSDLGSWIAEQPDNIEKYIIINAGGTPVPMPGSSKTFPMPAQTVMFITDSWNVIKQKEKHITYLEPHEIESIACADHCIIAMLEQDALLRMNLQVNIPDLHLSSATEYLILKK